MLTSGRYGGPTRGEGALGPPLPRRERIEVRVTLPSARKDAKSQHNPGACLHSGDGYLSLSSCELQEGDAGANYSGHQDA